MKKSEKEYKITLDMFQPEPEMNLDKIEMKGLEKIFMKM